MSKRGLNTDRDVIITFFIHYFHNDCHYAQPLIEFHFASQVCGERNNYHLSDIKIHAKHFHGQSLCVCGKRTCSALIRKEKKQKKKFKKGNGMFFSRKNEFWLTRKGGSNIADHFKYG